MPIEFKSDKLILVEGKDEVNFFKALLKKIGIESDVYDYEGKRNFNKKKFGAIKNSPGFENVKSLVLTMDADNSVENTYECIKNVLGENETVCPANLNEFVEDNGIKVGVYIMPDCENQGMLEDLCLKSVEEEDLLRCAEGFLKCVDSSVSDEEKPKNVSKAKAQTFLAGKKEIVKSVGLGAQKDYWNFDHECMSKIKVFLENLR